MSRSRRLTALSAPNTPRVMRSFVREHLPYLVEFDNYGRSRKPGEAGMGRFWVWGWDEITWFSQQPEGDRNEWLGYAWRWVREHDPAGYLQMPGLCCLAGAASGKRWYDANRPSAAAPNGCGQETAIRAIWASDTPGARPNRCPSWRDHFQSVRPRCFCHAPSDERLRADGQSGIDQGTGTI